MQSTPRRCAALAGTAALFCCLVGWTAPNTNAHVLEVSAVADGSFTVRLDVPVCNTSSTPNVARADLVHSFQGKSTPPASAGLSRMLSLVTAARLSGGLVRIYSDEPATADQPCALGAVALY